MTAPFAESAERSRRAHDYRSAWRAAFTVWFPLFGSIVAWAVHLVALTALVRLSCTRPGWLWAMHAITAATLAVTALALLLGWRLARPAGMEADAAPRRFLGVLALMFGFVNALLIVVEEVLVLALRSRRCG